MSGFGQRVGDAIVLIVFLAMVAVIVKPGSQAGSVIAAGGNAFSSNIKAATLQG